MRDPSSEPDVAPGEPVVQQLRYEERYGQHDVLGIGGIGTVLRAHDRQIGREIAIKLLRREHRSERGAARFVREARVQGQLEHPSVVPVYDLGVDPDGNVYFTMRRVRGVTMQDVIDGLRHDEPAVSSRFSRRRLLTDFSRLCLAVDYAHRRGVLHRDLKPSNVMLGQYGEVYLLDWGIARVRGSEDPELDEVELPSSEDRTLAGNISGTPGYMAPEQARGDRDSVGRPTDVYALGAILFELLTLRPLHEGETPQQLMWSTLDGADARPSVRAPDREIAPELETICVRATAPDPSERYATARQLQEAIEDHLDGVRDLERRKELASEHVRLAEEHVERVHRDRGDTSAARRGAMRELGRALAVDPENEAAVGTMGRLLREPPATTPAEVEKQLEDQRRHRVRTAARATLVGLLAMVALYLPLALWVGVRSWPTVGAFFAFVCCGAALSTWTLRAPEPRFGSALVTLFVLQAATATTAFIIGGPFLIVPFAAALNVGSSLVVLERHHRPWAVASAPLAVAVPWALELLDVVPPAYAFTEAGMVLVPRAIELPEVPIMALLVLMAATHIVVPTLTVARMRDHADEAERQLHTHTWHIEEILPDTVRQLSEPRREADAKPASRIA